MYPLATNSVYIQTDQIISMTVSSKVVLMSDGTTHTVTADQFADIIRCINENHG